MVDFHMDFKEVKPGIFESPKEGSMNVPVRVYATPALLERMRGDRTLWQASNVAQLPGILKAANVMSDGHEGYGFPIGGVAAFSLENGVISPGGIGYDINCLKEGTKVRHALGFSLPIEKYESFFSNFQASGNYLLSLSAQQTPVVSLNHQTKQFEQKLLLAFMKKKADKRMLELKTKCGLSIACSEDHPLFIDGKMKKASEINVGESVAVTYFEGVDFAFLENAFEKGILAKVLGYLMGDGTLTRMGKKLHVVAYGAEEDLRQMQQDLKALGYNSSIFFRSRKAKIKTQYGEREFTGSCHELHVYSQEFAKKMLELGLPLGKKASSAFGVPAWIKESPLWVQRLFLAGFFGSELTTPSTHTKTGFHAPVLAQNKNVQAKESGRLFLAEILHLLEGFGVQCTKLAERDEFENQQGKTVRLRLEISADEENLLRLWRTVGFEYNAKRQRKAEIAIQYMLLKKRQNSFRAQISKKTKEFKQKGLSLAETVALLQHPEANARFIERSYYEDVPSRIALSFVSFKEFSNAAEKQVEQYGTLLDEIVEIREVPYSGMVYDFTVQENHNFLANGFVVSNCGVRLLRSNLTEKDVRPKLKELINEMFKNIPCGVGSKGRIRLSEKELGEAVAMGVKYPLEKGYGVPADAEHCEENGFMEGGDFSHVSDKAKKRGMPQFGTLGSGNHFAEVQKVDKIYDEETAKAFGITEEGQVTFMVHSGSRGYGHQICDDNLRVMIQAAEKYGIPLPDKELCCAPLGSPEAESYLKQMRTAVNFAFCNRHYMAHWAREAFQTVFKQSSESLGLDLVYDVCHNIAKFEEHEFDGKKEKVCVHRKGATRAFWKGRKEIPIAYRNVGQPVLIPGSMNTASYVLVGMAGAKETFGSSCHGAGRVMSRAQALRTFRGEQVARDMENKGQAVRAMSLAGLAEEAGGAYKDVDEVVKAVETAGISKRVARLVPLGVVKG